MGSRTLAHRGAFSRRRGRAALVAGPGGRGRGGLRAGHLVLGGQDLPELNHVSVVNLLHDGNLLLDLGAHVLRLNGLLVQHLDGNDLPRFRVLCALHPARTMGASGSGWVKLPGAERLGAGRGANAQPARRSWRRSSEAEGNRRPTHFPKVPEPRVAPSSYLPTLRGILSGKRERGWAWARQQEARRGARLAPLAAAYGPQPRVRRAPGPARHNEDSRTSDPGPATQCAWRGSGGVCATAFPPFTGAVGQAPCSTSARPRRRRRWMTWLRRRRAGASRGIRRIPRRSRRRPVPLRPPAAAPSAAARTWRRGAYTP